MYAGVKEHGKSLRIDEIMNAYVINFRYWLLVEEMGNQSHRLEQNIETYNDLQNKYTAIAIQGSYLWFAMSAESRLQK